MLGKLLPEQTTKNAPSNSNKKSKKAVTAKTGFDAQSLKKGVQWLAVKQTQSRWKNCFAQPTCQLGQKTLSYAFRKYEIQKGQHLYRTQKKAGIHQCTCRLTKIQSILTKNQSFNRLYKLVFFPNKRYRYKSGRSFR